MSTFTDWDTETFEHFIFLSATYDVRAAKRILAKKPRESVGMNPSDLAAFAGAIGGEGPDPAKVNLEVPVILVTRKVPGKKGEVYNLPIDGWNRIRKALASGVAEIPAVILTLSESKKCEVKR